jgi:hypothetical protein
MPLNDFNTPLLEEIRERRTYAQTGWTELQDEARKDRLCVAGRPWDALDPNGKKQRKEANRPFLALDELGQYINQTVNDVRANPRGIKFAPTGNGANDEGAEFYQNHTREIEYRSHARVAYSTAFESAVSSGYGWLRVTTKREHPRTFDQNVWIEPIVNPDQVLADPNAVWPDSRDMKYLFYVEPWTRADFKARFPKAKVQDFSRELTSLATAWFPDDKIVQVGEYWRVVTKQRHLVAFLPPGSQDPSAVQFKFLDELPGGKLPEGVESMRDEEVDDPTVESYLTNGLEILTTNEWRGKYIPFVSCFGKVLYVDGKREILSMTRLARDPYMLYCYYRTTEAELAGMTPKFPYFAYEGQLSPTQFENLQKSLHEPVAAILVKPFVENGPQNQPLGFPSRQPYEPPFMGIEAAAEAARRSIQAAMGISPLPSDAQRHNQKSGVALRQIESSGQRGAFHFVDHYELLVERTGVLIEDLLDKVIDTKRAVPVRDQHDSASIVTVNDPSDPQSVTTQGDYRVTVSAGPTSDNQREEAREFVDSMVSNLAPIAQIVGPQKAAALLSKSVRLKQLGPIGDEIAEQLSPPEPKGQDGKPVPPEVAALMQENHALKQQVQQAQQAIESKQVEKQAEMQAQMQIEGMKQKAQTDRERELLQMKLAADIEKARITASKQSADLAAEAAEERIALGRQQLHEAAENARDRAHDVHMGIVDHQQAMQQADQAHGNALEQGVQAAALAPQPAEEGAEA